MKSAKEVISLIKEKAGGTIFSVGFIKKNGEFRHMICRLGVKAHLKGGDQGYDPVSKGLLNVFDVQKSAYRTITLDNIVWIKIRKQLYTLKKLAA